MASVAAAQTPPATGHGPSVAPDPRSDAKAHLGPIYLTPALAVREFGVDTNVFNDDENSSDFTFTVAPHADIWIPFARRALVTTSLTTDLVYYQRYASERSFNPDVRVRGDVFLNRVTFFAEPSYLSTRQRPNFEIDARARREERTALAGVGIRMFPRVTIELAGRHQQIDYHADATYNETNLQQTLNRSTRSSSATVRHELTPLTTLVLSASRSTDRFDFSPLRDADSTRVSPGVEFKPSALISGTAHVGVRRFETLSDALPDFTGTVASATLNYTLEGATRFTFNAERDTTYSYEALQPYFVVDGYGLTVRRQIVGRTDVIVATQRHTYSYRDLVLPGAPLSEIDRVDRTITWSATFGYRLGQTTRIGFGAIYRQRHSNIRRFRDYDGFRYTTTVDYGL
jgi:hypothetical protein